MEPRRERLAEGTAGVPVGGPPISTPLRTPRHDDHWVGLTAIRSVAMLLGITLHAAVAYMPTRMPGLVWPVYNSQTSWFCDIAFWWVHMLRLPIFFFLSGFFAELLYQRYGGDGFNRHRFRRITVPYVVGLLTIGPTTLAVFSLGWLSTGQIGTQPNLPYIDVPADLWNHSFGPAHLWFLLDLVLMSRVYWLVRRYWPSGSTDAPAMKTAHRQSSPWTPLLFILPGTLILWGDVTPVVAFNNSFLPDTARLFYYGTFFAVGAGSFRNRDWFRAATRYPIRHLLAAAPVSLLLLPALRTHFAAGGVWNRLLLAACVNSIAWLFIFGGIGLFIHRYKTRHGVVDYLADSSYWMYLCHLPLVALTQIALHQVELHAVLKFAIVSVVTASVGLMSYQALVRHTVVGRFLHGERPRLTETAPDVAAHHEGTEPGRRAA